MSTIHQPGAYITRPRKKPKKGSAGHVVAQEVFGQLWEKDLLIPHVIDNYNHYMHGVDITDQFRSYFRTERRCKKNWKPLLYFLLDVAVVNAYRLSAYCNSDSRLFTTSRKHFRFQNALAIALMRRCEDRRLGNKVKVTTFGRNQLQQPKLVDFVVNSEERLHKQVKGNQKECKACQVALRCRLTSKPERKPLTEVKRTILNENSGIVKRRSSARPARTNYYCELCNIPLCNNARCWDEHLAAVRLRAWQTL